MTNAQITSLLQTIIWAATVTICVFALTPTLNLWVRRFFDGRDHSDERPTYQERRARVERARNTPRLPPFTRVDAGRSA